jgi:hypothetical protein
MMSTHCQTNIVWIGFVAVGVGLRFLDQHRSQSNEVNSSMIEYVRILRQHVLSTVILLLPYIGMLGPESAHSY